jgi:ABC-type transport system substrate-binding protein
MSEPNYWTKVVEGRLSRRRVLVGSGAAALGAAFLAACGGGDKKQSGSGLVAPSVSTTDKAVKGGTAVFRVTANPLNMDSNGSGGNVDVRSATEMSYRQLLLWDHGTSDKPPEGKVIGDAFQSWEASPDGTRYTFKLRPQKFDPRPPTNGKDATTADVKWSMERFEKLHAGRALLFNSVHQDGPVSGIEYPDANTVVMKLAFPTHYLLGALATWLSPPFLMPLEAEDKFDIKNAMRGTGPFMLTEYQPDIHRKYERMPNFWAAPKYPFLDGLDYINIPEAGTWLTQFEAGRIWAYTPPNEEVLNLKRRLPSVNLNATYNYGSPGSGNTSYYMFSDLPGSIFKDQRVRYAVSMLLDRDLALEAIYNISNLEAAGITIDRAWHGTASALWGNKMLDPKKGALGDASKYWQHNPDEAAKLLRAASAFGTEQTYTTYITGASAAGGKEGDVVNQMLQDGGHFKNIKFSAIDLATQFLPGYHFGKGQFDGMAYLTYGGYPEFGLYIWNAWMPSGRNAVRNVPISPRLDDLARKHRAEFDDKKRNEIEVEWQKEMATVMPTVPWPGIATSFTLTQPWFGNGGQVKTWGWPTQYEANTYYNWYDKSKDTRKA